MQSTIIKPATKELSPGPSLTQKFVNAFCEMDLLTIEPMISDNSDFKDKGNKYNFMAWLKDEFDKLKAKGDTHFIATFGHCSFCNRNSTGYKFISDKTSQWLSFVLKENTDGTIDVKVCDNILPLDVLEGFDNEDLIPF